MLTAKDIMTREVITVSEDMSVEKLAALLWEKKISGAPVVDEEGQLLGVVTENDLVDQAKRIHIPTVITILDSFLYLESPQKVEKEIKKIAGITVSDIYSQDPVTVTEDMAVEDIATILAERKIHTLPVVSGNKIVGVIGKSDIIRTLIPKR